MDTNRSCALTEMPHAGKFWCPRRAETKISFVMQKTSNLGVQCYCSVPHFRAELGQWPSLKYKAQEQNKHGFFSPFFLVRCHMYLIMALLLLKLLSCNLHTGITFTWLPALFLNVFVVLNNQNKIVNYETFLTAYFSFNLVDHVDLVLIQCNWSYISDFLLVPEVTLFLLWLPFPILYHGSEHLAHSLSCVTLIYSLLWEMLALQHCD